MTAMTSEVATGSPAQRGRAEVERYLAERLREDGGEVVPYVAVLGMEDLVATAPEAPGGSRMVLPVHLGGAAAVVGPLRPAGPAEPPCHHCVALRWQKLRPSYERDVLELGGTVRPVGASPFLTPFALEAIWELFARLAAAPLGGADGDPFPFVHELRLDTLRLRRYPLIADSSCPVCSRPRPDTPVEALPELVSRRKRGPGEYRLAPAADQDLPLAAFANPVCGMLGSAANPDLDSTTVSAVTGYLYVRRGWHLLDFFWSGHADAFDESAQLAVCEGLERHAGLLRSGVTGLVVDSYEHLAEVALDPRECGLYSDEFYDDPGPFPFTRFRPDQPLPWVWGRSLRDRRPVLVPERLVYYLGGTEAAGNFVQECSNGCAAGSCLEEAIFYGMLELIERDAFLLGWYGKVELPEIDPATCRSDEVRVTIDRIALQGYDVRLFDNRIDLPVPVVTAVATRRDGALGALCLASGASFDPDAAVRAALCEVAAYVPGFVSRTESQREQLEAMAADFYKVTDLHHHPLLFGLPEMAGHAEFLLAERERRPVQELYRDWERRRPRTLDLLDDLHHCRDLLVDAGFDVIAVEQTSPEQRAVGMRTACVIAPGLIPIDFGWARQRALRMPRMRTAFRRAGWREDDLDPAELHLVPHPFP